MGLYHVRIYLSFLQKNWPNSTIVQVQLLMRFHPKSKAFWHVGYHTWHGKGLLLLSGSKNRSEVRNKLTKRGYYNLNTSFVNLVVPDVKILFNTNDIFPKNINPQSCIKESFELLTSTKSMYLCMI